MTEAITRFFEGLNGRSYDPVYGVGGTVRFELKEGDQTEYWVVKAEDRELRVSRDTEEDVDAVFVADTQVFDSIVRGGMNAISAVLRDVLHIRGDLRLFLLIERFLPAPLNTRGPRHVRARRQGEERS